jgi:hypothetical protein
MTASIARKSDFSTVTSEDEFQVLKYDSLDLQGEDSLFGVPQSTIFRTEAGRSVRNDSLSELNGSKSSTTLSQPQGDLVLSEAEGVIDRINEHTVRVKLFPKTYANFPSILFKEQEKISQGQHIKYLIKKDREGYRYQEIEAIEIEKTHPEKNMVLKLLDELKYRDE